MTPRPAHAGSDGAVEREVPAAEAGPSVRGTAEEGTGYRAIVGCACACGQACALEQSQQRHQERHAYIERYAFAPLTGVEWIR